MKILKYLILSICFISACTHKEKVSEVSESVPPVSEIKAEAPAVLRAARANMKSIHGKKVSGILNFAQAENNIKVDVQLEGLQSGPYEWHLAHKSSCAKPSLKYPHRDQVQVIADKNGVVKANVEMANLVTQDLIGKTVVLQRKGKKASIAVACGVIEKAN